MLPPLVHTVLYHLPSLLLFVKHQTFLPPVGPAVLKIPSECNIVAFQLLCNFLSHTLLLGMVLFELCNQNVDSAADFKIGQGVVVNEHKADALSKTSAPQRAQATPH